VSLARFLFGQGKRLATLQPIPPGPRGLPLLGNTLQYTRDPLGFLTRCAREYGDVVRLTGPGRVFHLVSRPDLIEQVLRGDHRHFVKWELLRATSRVFGSGLLTSEGDLWKRQRRLANPSFSRQQVLTYADGMVDAAVRLTDTWRDGETRVVSDDMVRLTLAVVARALFGVDVGADRGTGEVLGAVLDYYGDPLNSLVLPAWLPTPAARRFRRAVQALDQFIGGLIEARRARAEEGGDLLSRLLAARDDDGTGMTDRQLRDELVTMAFAGHKTSAAALSYCLYLLAQDPKADARLAEELDAVLGGRPPTADDLPRLTYAEWVVKEALRLYPPSWGIGREALTDGELGGYFLPKGTQVLLPQYVVHRDPRWFAEPERFRPERWADDAEKRLPRCAYFPFGDGPRGCIGSHFAMTEVVLILATLAQRFRWTPVPGRRVRLVPSITLWPKPGLAMVLRRRDGALRPTGADRKG